VRYKRYFRWYLSEIRLSENGQSNRLRSLFH